MSLGRVFYIVLILAAGCSKSPLGPDISERPDSVATDSVTSGAQTTGVSTDSTVGADTSAAASSATSTSTTNATPPTCAETTTQNFFYPGATVAHSLTCNLTITAVLDQTANRPTYLTASAVGSTAITFTGTQSGATGATNWTTRFNGATDVVANTTILATTPTTTAEVANSLGDNVLRSLTFSVALDGTYDGTGAGVKVLMSDAVTPATTSNGAASFAASDIPLLTYSDAGACTASPIVCPTTGSNTQTTATAGFDVLWNYNIFDQGDYDVGTRGYLSLEGAKVYSAADYTVLTTVDVTGEKNLIAAATSVGRSTFKGPSTWFNFTPAIALNDTLSTSPKQVFGVVFPALNATTSHFAGVATVDRGVDPTDVSKIWFDPTNTATRLSLAANTQSMAIAQASTNDWIYFGGSDGGGGSRNLVLTYVNDAGASVTLNQLTAYADGTKLFSTAITQPFNDGGTQRHGIAWFGQYDPAVTDIRRIWISKIKSSPTDPAVDADYFDASTYYVAAGNELAGTISSVPVTVNQAATLSMVKIVARAESGTNYFYVSWRNDTDDKIYFARVEASPSAAPNIKLTRAGDQISNLDAATATILGRPAYAIAAGATTTGTAILGVLYAEQDGGVTACTFQAFRVVGEEVQKYGTARSFGTPTDCRFPNLFYNESAGRFMATYIDGTSGDTYYAEFGFNAAGDALSPASPTDVRVTDRTALPCNFAAGYSETWHRLGMVSLESSNCGANAADSIKFDVYKPGRR